MKLLLPQLNNWLDQIQEVFCSLYLKIVSIIDPQKPYFVSNYFKTRFQKRALISYVIEPFIIPIKTKRYYSHSNNAEALVIAKTLHKHRFQVDIIKFDATHIPVPAKQKYQLIFGLSPNIDRFYKKSPKAIFVPYTTGSSAKFQNKSESKRLQRLYKRTGVILKRRLVAPSDIKTLNQAKCIIGIGNNFTKSTFPLKIQKKMRMITVSTYNFFSWNKIKSLKNFSVSKNHFLWWGGYGAVLKGLDLLLETFIKTPHLHLHITGNLYSEPDFIKLYQKHLFHTNNIHFYGWTNLYSKKYRDLVNQSAFIIFPSASESITGSVASCMHSGLIPIITPNTGIKPPLRSLVLSDTRISTIISMIKKASYLPTSKLKQATQVSYKIAQKNYTLEKFTNDFENAINNILVQTNH